MEKVTTYSKVTIVLYTFLSVGLGFYYHQVADIEAKKNILFWYAFGTQSLLYALNYHSLRNLIPYIFWCGIGLMHFFLFWNLKDDTSLWMQEAHAATGLRNTIILLVLFQILRIISYKMQGSDLVMISRMDSKDIFDERITTPIDFLLFLIYMGSVIGLLFVPIYF